MQSEPETHCLASKGSEEVYGAHKNQVVLLHDAKTHPGGVPSEASCESFLKVTEEKGGYLVPR